MNIIYGPVKQAVFIVAASSAPADLTLLFDRTVGETYVSSKQKQLACTVVVYTGINIAVALLTPISVSALIATQVMMLALSMLVSRTQKPCDEVETLRQRVESLEQSKRNLLDRCQELNRDLESASDRVEAICNENRALKKSLEETLQSVQGSLELAEKDEETLKKVLG